MLEMAGDERGSEGARGVHGGTANGAGEHGLQGDDAADGDAGGDAFFLGAGADAEDDEHEEEGEHDLEDEALRGKSGGEGGAEFGVGGEEEAEKTAGGE